MAEKIAKGTLTGVFDVNGREIANGDRLKVQHITIEDAADYIDCEFTAEVFYDEKTASFRYMPLNSDLQEEERMPYYFNHRKNTRFEVF